MKALQPDLPSKVVNHLGVDYTIQPSYRSVGVFMIKAGDKFVVNNDFRGYCKCCGKRTGTRFPRLQEFDSIIMAEQWLIGHGQSCVKTVRTLAIQ